mgnify:CR=1 FL=1
MSMDNNMSLTSIDSIGQDICKTINTPKNKHICDVPGCEKSYSQKFRLAIHKRTHVFIFKPRLVRDRLIAKFAVNHSMRNVTLSSIPASIRVRSHTNAIYVTRVLKL